SFETLRGGLESPAVTRVGARFFDPGGRPRSLHFVVKRLEGGPAREADLYESRVAESARGMSPELLGVERTGDDRCLLFLEAIRTPLRWPWRDPAQAGLVLERLAAFHASPAVIPPVAAWDYESDLLAAAGRTLSALEELPRAPETRTARRALPALRRVVRNLPALRRWLMELPGLEATVIHGDAHPGNVLLRSRRGLPEPVLLDWGRARVGSPLEDVSSWLQSLGYWEPQARRRHDTLLLRYLAARGLPGFLDRRRRDAYWIAGASNVLAGALSYHLWRFREADSKAEAGRPLHAALDALRIIRRAVQPLIRGSSPLAAV
ncbi:MAG TPA: aminoglycoside phosphotransferase family protein, partial [Thermoanaerobaculia bacterium]|nr:aminoglycoside phosphotransferase family protein [Thermoanaerobaculia bacterium]